MSLLVDEIHQKPYIDYKGGNIVGLSDNNNQAATSAFAFMLSSVFSQYKDVVHVMPIKCLKAENLFDRVKRIIIGLEEIGFQVLSIITDNNAINKKTYIFLLQSPTAFYCISTSTYKLSTCLFLFNSVHILKFIRNNSIDQKDVSRPAHKHKEIGLLTSLKTVHPATTRHDETDMTLICRYSLGKGINFI